MDLGYLRDFAIGFVVLGIVLAVGALILAEVQDQVETSGNDTTAFQAVQYSLDAVSTLSSWQGIIAIAGVATLVLGIVLYAFYTKGTGPSY